MSNTIVLPSKQKTARFVTGSIMRHVLVMAATGSVGLFAVFLVDFLTLAYIAQLGDHRLTAAVGAATLIMFLCRSVNVGLMVAVGALVSKNLGQRKREEARHVGTASIVILCIGTLFVSMLAMPLLPVILPMVGAGEEIYQPAAEFLYIVLPANVIAAFGMGLAAVLRAYGEARRSMIVTLAGGAATAVSAPLFIFGFHLGIVGAALAAVVSNVVMALCGAYYTVFRMQSLAIPRWKGVVTFARPVGIVGIPAIMTMLAPPVGDTFVAKMIAGYGVDAYAAYTIVGRFVPVAFCGFFALSGCVGPILGQNWGAGRFDRMRLTLKDSTVLSFVYVLVVWALLIYGHGLISKYFLADAYTADLIRFFCYASGGFWFFNGMLFTANASFNNLGFPFLATFFNWGRAVLGVIPFGWIGGYLAGVKGIYAGTVVGASFFGVAGLLTAFWTVNRLERRARKAAERAAAARGA
ncbi:MAG: MATE family efflux transporter [Methylobacteriaceae bacterium]|jgi:putative MATE family efflux protein|nr:MATE family efflux transporter [Methylobacteriaceae bacterium]